MLNFSFFDIREYVLDLQFTVIILSYAVIEGKAQGTQTRPYLRQQGLLWTHFFLAIFMGGDVSVIRVPVPFLLAFIFCAGLTT